MVDRLVSSLNTQLPYFLWDAAAVSANTDVTRLIANVTASASVRNPCLSVMGGALWYVTHVGSSKWTLASHPARPVDHLCRSFLRSCPMGGLSRSFPEVPRLRAGRSAYSSTTRPHARQLTILSQAFFISCTTEHAGRSAVNPVIPVAFPYPPMDCHADKLPTPPVCLFSSSSSSTLAFTIAARMKSGHRQSSLFLERSSPVHRILQYLQT